MTPRLLVQYLVSMLPKVDPQVRYVGSSSLRGLTRERLKGLTGAIVVQDNDAEPLVVILPYVTYLAMQSAANLGDDIEEFDARRQEIRARMARGARQTEGRKRR